FCSFYVDNVDNFLKTSVFPPFFGISMWITWKTPVPRFLQIFTILYILYISSLFSLFLIFNKKLFFRLHSDQSPDSQDIGVRGRKNSNSSLAVDGVDDLPIAHVNSHVSVIQNEISCHRLII